jgi:hypothetical protein
MQPTRTSVLQGREHVRSAPMLASVQFAIISLTRSTLILCIERPPI